MSMSKKAGMCRQSLRRLDMVLSNQKILQNFLGTICKLVSKGTSDKYAAMVIKRFNKSNSARFPFVKHIRLYSNRVKVDKEVNSNDPELIGKFIKMLIDSLFSDLFKHLIKRKLDIGLLVDLRSIGVRF